MAIFHFSLRHITRKAGRSATAAAAYRNASRILDERTGVMHDYRRKRGVLDSQILAPARAPEWARTSASLWNAVENYEKRKDARLVREINVALPHELTLEQNREMLHAYVEEHFVKRGMAAQVDIHGPDKHGDKRNVHAHILLTPRPITRNGFKELKPRNWNDKETLQQWRQGWADHMNRALEKAKVAERVDHSSYDAREIDRQPTKHLGPEASQMERRGRRSRIGDENRQASMRNRQQATRERTAKKLAAAIARERTHEATRDRQPVSHDNRSAVLNAAQNAHRDAMTHLNDRYAALMAKTEAENRDLYGKRNESLQRELEAIKERFEAGGLFYHLRRGKADRQRAQELRLSIQDGEARAQERLAAIAHDYEAEKSQIDRRYEEAKRQAPEKKLGLDFPTPEQQREQARTASREAGRGRDREGPGLER